MRDDVALVRLTNGATNPIDPSLIEDLFRAVATVRRNAAALVLAGGDKFFSIGLDLPQVLKLNRSDMRDYWYRFNQLAFDLYTLPIPTVCALAGHAVAGGGVLALTGDFRLAADPDKQIGLNEAKLGLPAPYIADLILRQLVGDRVATPMLYDGHFVSFAQAEKIRLIDAMYSPDQMEAAAVVRAAGLAACSGAAFAAFKANRTETIRNLYRQNHQHNNDLAVELWFSEPVQTRLHEAAKKF
jgi:enoyl-CoA hydratase/carnithine racemase